LPIEITGDIIKGRNELQSTEKDIILASGQFFARGAMDNGKLKWATKPNMETASILAHRGMWSKRCEANTLESLERALLNGFGLETDVRDLNGRLVISHDPPLESSEPPTLQSLFDIVKRRASPGRIALNIKADGLCAAIQDEIKASGINPYQIFVFDMSVPDSMHFLDKSIPTYTRVSEFEDCVDLIKKATGVWVDNIKGEFPQVLRSADLLTMGTKVAIVSPELHGREHLPVWKSILDYGVHNDPNFELCTDFPSEASQFFCNTQGR
jgi:hypothetical protein